MKKVIVLGATGTIGLNTLSVIDSWPDNTTPEPSPPTPKRC